MNILNPGKDKEVNIILRCTRRRKFISLLHCKYNNSGNSNYETHPGIVESESEERQLVVEILVQLWIGGVDVLLVVSHLIVIGSLVEEPVHEVAANLGQALSGNRVPWAIIAICLGLFWCNTVLGICK